jgi:hypothetical protein
MHESLHTDAWLVTTLEAALGGDISGAYSGVIPSNKTLPAVRFHVQSASDLMVVEGHRIWANLLYLVAAVVEGSPVPLLPLADGIDTALHRSVGETSTIRVMSCVRETPFRLTETNEGKVYRHAGGLYRIHVQAK